MRDSGPGSFTQTLALSGPALPTTLCHGQVFEMASSYPCRAPTSEAPLVLFSPESLQPNLTFGSQTWVTPSQLFSSLESMQSVSPSQRHRRGMHSPSSRHWNSSVWQPPGGLVAGGDGARGGWRGGHQEGGALWLRPFPPPLPSLEAELRRPGAFCEPADSPEALTLRRDSAVTPSRAPVVILSNAEHFVRTKLKCIQPNAFLSLTPHSLSARDVPGTIPGAGRD